MRILLTNDDGIHSPGLAALYEALTEKWDVTVVAPAEDQSGVGRTRSDLSFELDNEITISDHEWGYVVDGTPADCVAVGLRHIPEAEEIDLVVSGANNGPNVGSYILGHSGTVGAAVEAAFLGTPAVAVSGYDHDVYFPEDGDRSFDAIAAATRDLLALIENTSLFEGDTDYLNVNAPAAGSDTIALTRPLADYDTRVVASETEGESETFESNYWATHPVEGDGFPIGLDGYEGDYPAWSDRAAIVAGEISVTPLGMPQEVVDPPADVVAALDRYPIAKS